MILTATKHWVGQLYRPAIMAMLANCFVLILMSSQGRAIYATTETLIIVTLIFAAENFLLCMWLQWSKQQQQLWHQLTLAEVHRQLIFVPILLIFTLLCQLLPLSVFITARQTVNVEVTSLDYLAFTMAWLLAMAGYVFGMIFSWWRHWSMALVLVSGAIFLSAYDVPLVNFIQMLVAVFMLAVVFAASKDFVRRIAFSFTLIMGITMLLALFGWELFAGHFDNTEPYSKQVYNFELGQGYEGERSDYGHYIGVLELKSSRRLTTPRTREIRIDWQNYRLLPGNDSEFVSSPYWQANQAYLEQLWRQHHKEQIPFHFNIDGKLGLVFNDAIYQSTEGNFEREIWKAENSSDKLSWVGREIRYGSESILLFGNDTNLYMANWDKDGAVKIKTYSIDSKPQWVYVSSYTKDSGTDYYLTILDSNIQTNRYLLQGIGKELIQLNEDLKLTESEGRWDRILSMSATVYVWQTLVSPYSIESPDFSLFFLSHLIAALLSVWWFRANSKSHLGIKTALTLLLGIPMFIALAISFRKNSGNSVFM